MLANICLQGGICGISNEKYHSGPGISRSALMELRRSPFHFYAKYLDVRRPVYKPTEAMMIGQALHMLTLENHLFEKEFVILPEGHGSSKIVKDAKADAVEAGKSVLSVSDYEMILNMKNSFLRADNGLFMTPQTKFEKSMFWHDKKTGVLCKSRPDAYLIKVIDQKKFAFVLDLKSAIDASPDAFERMIYSYGYHIQCAMQAAAISTILGIEKCNIQFWFGVVEKTYPYACGIYDLGDFSVECGETEFRKNIELYKSCHDKNEWPSYGFKQVCLKSYDVFKIESPEGA